MRIVLSPNAFRDCLSAQRVVEAMARGVRFALPEAEIIEAPMADGGDGTASVLGKALQTSPVPCHGQDPLGRPISAPFHLTKSGDLALIELAETCGMAHLSSHERQPLSTSSYGFGLVVARALEKKPKRLIIALGGSATIDGGAGFLAALGAQFLNKQGQPLQPTPIFLKDLDRHDLSQLDKRLGDTSISVLCDVDTPLQDCIPLFGPQKGAVARDYPTFESLLQKLFPNQADHQKPMFGAAGGIAAALASYCGAKLKPGAWGVAELINLKDQIEKADLVFTGEGCLDATTSSGKAPFVVSRLAAECHTPCAVMAGRIHGEFHRFPAPIFCISQGPKSLEQAIEQAPENLTHLAQHLTLFFKGAISP